MIRSITASVFFLLAFAATATAQTIAHWTFDDGTDGQKFSVVPATDKAGNSYKMRGDPNYGPVYSTRTESGTGLCSRHNNQDGYVGDRDLIQWSPEKWTIEISVNLDSVEGRRIIMSRDGSSEPEGINSDFCLEKNTPENRFALSFYTVGQERYSLQSDFVPLAGQWYRIALISNGRKVSMYVDRIDGKGYQLEASIFMSGSTPPKNALAAPGKYWSFGRGWERGKFLGSIRGYLDDIRFTGRALAPAELLHAVR